MLRFVAPMKPVLAADAPEGDGWIHEVKHDGYRTQLAIDAGDARAFTSSGLDWTARYRPIAAAAAELGCSSALIDGEIVVQDEVGRSSFGELQAELGAGRADRLVFYGFDLIQIGGEDLRRRPIEERRSRLEQLLGDNDPHSCLHFSSSVVGGGGAFFAAVDQLGLEGIVSKRAGSCYRSGSSRDWLKVKAFAVGELVVLGVERERGKPSIALLGREGESGLAYCGGAMVTLSELQRDRFWRLVEQLPAETPAATVPGHKAAQWLKPEIRVKVRYLKGEGKLRHATLLGLVDQPDRPAQA